MLSTTMARQTTLIPDSNMKRSTYILLSITFLYCGTCNFSFASESKSELELSAPQNIESAIRQVQARFDSGNIYGAWTLAEEISEKYPDNDDVRSLLNNCISREAEDYRASIESLSVDKLKEYLQVYKGKARISDVNERIQDLPLWNIARQTNSIAAYKDYISKSTYKKYESEAKSAIDGLQLEQDWKSAKNSNTFAAFEGFRKTHPMSKYDSEASNKMAKCLADKFTKNSTDVDKMKALGYATNEITRDYVKNKFNTSRSKTSNSYGTTSSTYGSANNSSRNTSYGSTSSINYKNNIPVDKGFNLGIVVFFDEGDAYSTILGGFGLEWRLWKFNSLFNVTTGVKIAWSKYSTWYDNGRVYYGDKPYEYNLDYGTVSGKATHIIIPAVLNWNIYRGDFISFYIGAGYQLGFAIGGNAAASPSGSVVVQGGLGGRHADFRIYYTRYQNSPFIDRIAKTPVFGVSFTYFF